MKELSLLDGTRLCRRLCVGLQQTVDLRTKPHNLPHKYLYFWHLETRFSVV